MVQLTRAQIRPRVRGVDFTVKSAKGYARTYLPNGCYSVHTTAVCAWVKARGFDPKKGTLPTESKAWAVDPKTGVKKALTSNGEWFDTSAFGSKNGIATQSGDEDDTFAADAPLADAAFGK